MECPKCGAENPEYAAYCGNCSAQLWRRRISEGVKGNGLACQSCGNENAPEDRYCRACGSYLLQEEVAEEGWTKTYGIPGFYESSISDGPRGAEIRTWFSFLGFEETTRYPRWMITSMIWFVLGLTLFLGLLLISEALKADRTDMVGLGLGIVAVDILAAHFLYRVYYRPPRHRIG